MVRFPHLHFLVGIPYGIARRLPEDISELSKLDD